MTQWARDELSKQLAKVMSDFQDVEDERDAAERERDAALARAEKAERERDGWRAEWVAGGEALTPHAQFDTINTKHPQAKALEHFRSLVATIGEHTVPEARVCHDLVNLSQVVGLLDRQIAAIYANQPGFLVDTMIRPEGDGRAVR